ncbi:hypothetical protein [Dysgonomonas reticulitermitis]
MNIKISPLLLFLWIALTLLPAFFNIYNKKADKHTIESSVVNNLDQKENESFICYMKLSAEIQDSYFKNKTSFVEFFNGKYSLLIYRYSKNMCNSCIEEDLSELYNYQSIIGKDKILVLPAYDDTRDDKIILMNELSRFNYKNLSGHNLLVPVDLDMITKRYFACIDSIGKISMIFFPIRGKQELTQTYFSEISKRIK